MAEQYVSESTSNEGGVVIPFPTNRTTPPPLPRLSHTYPTPGGGNRYAGSSMFSAACARRFDQEAA